MVKQTVSRREFLKYLGALAAAGAVSRLGIQPTFAQDEELIYERLLDLYIDKLERPHLAPLNELYTGAMDSRPIGMILHNLTENQLLVAVQTEQLMPVASAFKAGVLMYFIHQVDPAVWNSVPVEYWLAQDDDELPEEYRAAWREHAYILRDLNQMIMISDNPATGRVLGYVARLQGSDQPLMLFNDWSHNVVGVSQLSALSSWNHGVPGDMDVVDQRYTGRVTNIRYNLVPYENLMTPRDLGLYYVWMLKIMDADQQQVCRQVLSLIANDRRGNLEKLAFNNGGISYSKNGALSADESGVGTVITDAGLIELEDGHLYLVAFLSADADQIVPTAFQMMDETINGQHTEEIKAFQASVMQPTTPEAFLQHLETYYPESAAISPDLFNYAFVKVEGIPVYRQPNEANPLRNPVISSSRFGVHLLMAGALVRFREIDERWVELLPDDARDNVQTRLGAQIFVERENLWVISPDYARPIPNITDSTVTHDEKYVVIHLSRRELTAFERGNVVMKVPIILNPYATPRGSYVITSKWFARSMQPWAPGVPFTAFFDTGGYALHGSPWQHWEATVNLGNIEKRTSAGCVNIPNWEITAGSYTRPADELLFRWLGGSENPETKVYEYPSRTYGATRIYVVDYLENLNQYSPTLGMRNANLGWADVSAISDQTILAAPDSFFTTA